MKRLDRALLGALSLLAFAGLAFGEGSPAPRRWRITRASQRGDLQRIDARLRELEQAERVAVGELKALVAEIRSDLAIPPDVQLRHDDEKPYEVLLEVLPSNDGMHAK